MRIELKNLLLCFLLGAGLLTSAAFGQVTQIFDGHSTTVPPFPAYTNVDVSSNYVGNILPNSVAGDTAEFDGRLPGNLVLNYIGNWQGGIGLSGVNLHLTSNQIGSVVIDNLNGAGNPPILAFYNITIDAGAGAFQIAGETNLFNYAGRPAGAIHHLINNSTNTATIGSRIRMIAGGGQPLTFDFMGTGNWQVDHFLVTDSTPNNNTSVQVDSSGIVTWYPSTSANVPTGNSINSVTVNSGLLILTTNYTKISNVPFVINGAFRFNCPLQPSPQVFNGTVSGTGLLQVSAGTLTLAGANVFSSTNLLSGGELVAGRAENFGVSGPLGVGGKISFAGGTLGYSAANAFDYSSRFDSAPGQAYSIDTAGQSVVFNSALSSVGGSLTKLGLGTLTLAGTNGYTGTTTVSGGKLVIQRLSGTGAITVADDATLGVTEGSSQILPATLTLGATSTLEFNNVTNQTVPPLVAGSVSATGPVTINLNSGSFDVIGQSYPLFSWNSGPAPAVLLGNLPGIRGVLSTNTNTIVFTVTVTRPPLGFSLASANSLQFTWDTSLGNYKLQWQTNGLGTNWGDYPGGSLPGVTVPIDQSFGGAFFRLLSTP